MRRGPDSSRASRRAGARARAPRRVGCSVSRVRRGGDERRRRDAARLRGRGVAHRCRRHARDHVASTFLTRLRLGPALVDAKGVSQLYEGRVHRLDIALLVAAALVAIVVVVIVSRPIHTLLDGFRLTIEDLWDSLTR
ncbi:MAG: hypothetical protein E6G60_05710 [Actinobacteria bacterium]|nr:MAG: hypothetical protein E6G60_05710 [Actinomycetota bacterium]